MSTDAATQTNNANTAANAATQTTQTNQNTQNTQNAQNAQNAQNVINSPATRNKLCALLARVQQQTAAIEEGLTV